MNPDDSHFKDAWQTQASQTRRPMDAELLLNEVRRNQQHFTAALFWRDVREMGLALVMVPLWFYLGIRLALPWTWYLTVPWLVWIAGYMLSDLRRQKRQPPAPGEPLRQRVESSLAQVEHQIRLLRNVLWWALAPLALAMLAFFAHVAWLGRAEGWLTALVFAAIVLLEVIVLAGAYKVNQDAVRCELEPRRQELEALLMSLQDETPP